MLDFGTAVFLFIYRTFVHFYVDTERTFCYIIEKNKCLGGVSLMTKKFRITSRIRFTIFVVLVIVLFTTAVNFALGFNVADSSTIPEYIQIEVEPGETLWSIAGSYMSENSDIRECVYQLCRINNITAADLQAGMTIQVPIN